MVEITELTDYIFSLVRKSGLLTFKYRNPNNQKGTFVVVNPLALVGTKEQLAIVNVNVYTDNLKIGSANNDYSQPDAKEIKRAINLILPHIQDNDWGDNILVRVEQSSPVYEETQTFINIRIDYRKINY